MITRIRNWTIIAAVLHVVMIVEAFCGLTRPQRAVFAGYALALLGMLFGIISPADGALGLIIANVAAPFPVNPVLTGIALAYKNNRLIADQVLPRVPVGSQAFRYPVYPKGEMFTVPETEVGRRGRPNQVEFTATETESSTVDHALDDGVPNSDIALAATLPNMPNPLNRATEGLTALLELGREVRTATLVFDPAQYATANKVALGGNDRWHTKHADSDPLTDILAGFDVPLMRPNLMVLGQSASIALRTHPRILKSFNGSEGDQGLVPLSFVRELFELEDVIVGQGWVNTARRGQAASMVRVWGGHCALLYRDKTADTQNGTTFGFTAQWGGRIAGNEYDRNIGMRGGQIVRVGESVRELLMASDLGYLIQDAAA